MTRKTKYEFDFPKIFVADLVHINDVETGYIQGGSDERHMAWEYFLRHGYAFDYATRDNRASRFEYMPWQEAHERDKARIAKRKKNKGK